jgi:hypothetical protein
MPIINAGLARSDQPDLTLSVFAVAWGLGMIVLSPFYMLHQIPLSYYEEGGKNRSIRLFHHHRSRPVDIDHGPDVLYPYRLLHPQTLDRYQP